ncbi:alpha/beta hydrolase [Neosynechococcus sphagnicola]|uniref:alpha/beta hydrolase n=1 Tax=Neosynechococcus sphagnicola TaxID=1501145 RepID=UPI00195530F9|nr:alpha/beta hydrolase [Neosynechococcus sphagnicola]
MNPTAFTYQFPFQPFLCGLALALSSGFAASPSLAAERLTIRVGFFEQSVEIAELEQFAQTGRLSAPLQPYAPFLTLEFRQLLSRQLPVVPKLSEKFMTRLLQSSSSQPLLQALGNAIPGTTLPQWQAALSQATRQSRSLNVLSLLKAFPTETLTINATAAIALLSQLNPAFWQTQALSPTLERELAAPMTPLPHNLDPAASGLEVVHRQSLKLTDPRRQRSIAVDLYWSDTPQNQLVVISHGLGADRVFLAYLADHLASHGFTVAIPEHPGSNADWLQTVTAHPDFSALLPPNELIDRPQDISFLLDELAKLNRQPGILQGKLPTHQVSVIGHSLGGTTALMLAGAVLDLPALQQFCRNHSPLGKSPADWLQCAAVTNFAPPVPPDPTAATLESTGQTGRTSHCPESCDWGTLW